MEYYLQHHGIKGQKWGVRRYQNEDGTLTEAGKKRYGFWDRRKHGREISRDYNKAYYDTLEKLQSESKEYQEASRKQNKIADRYGLDEDGRPTKKLDEATGLDSLADAWDQRQAAKRYKEQEDIILDLNEDFYKKAEAYAEKTVISKYGDTALSDMNRYRGQNAAALVTAILLAGGTMLIANSINR